MSEYDNSPADQSSVDPHDTHPPGADKESVRWVENLKQSTRQLGAPSRCVHVCDREADIFELFAARAKAANAPLDLPAIAALLDRIEMPGGAMARRAGHSGG